MRRYTISLLDGEQLLSTVSFDSSLKAQGALEMFWCMMASYPLKDVMLVMHIEEVK